MNDAERDAWLREALRHAPDSQALPPRGVSEAILAKARAAARTEQARPARAARVARPNPLAAFWNRLARPPVAAGFATVMVATLVGLMWWDQPMDETLPRRPEAASERAKAQDRSAAPALQSAAPLAKNEASASTSTGGAVPATTEPLPAAANDARDEGAQSRRQQAPGERTTVGDDKAARSLAAEKRKMAGVVGRDDAARDERKVQTPSPFAPLEKERDALAAKPAPTAKKDAATPPPSAAEERTPSDAAVAQSSPAAEAAAAPAAPPAAGRLRAQAEATQPPARRRDDGDGASTSAANGANLDAAKSAPAPTITAAPAAAPAPALRSGALGELREKQASAFGSAPPAATAPGGRAEPAAPMRNEVAAAQRQNKEAAAPLASVLGTIASEPARWSRVSASGDVVALDAGWRDWLVQLDAAAAGRWQPLVGTANADSERDGATTLRLTTAGRPGTVVRLAGTTARIDGPVPGERWQASLPADVAERLRAAAARLPR